MGPNGPRGPRPKIKGSWWRRWTLRKALGVLGGIVGSFILLITLGIVYVYSKTPIPTAAAQVNLYQNSTVYYADGHTVMGTFGQYDRQILNYNQIPKIMQDSVLAAEDRSFWTEGGVSPRGILRAAYEDIFGSGNSLQGGSTITQQFVRNYYQGIGTSQTASRKIKEIFVAIKIARARSKPWILTNYMNTIYLGDGAYGVGAAAQMYFREPVAKLTPAQAAVIAAIIQQPTNYPLPQYHNDLVARWHYVLTGLVAMHDLTAAQAQTMKFPDMNTSGQLQTGNDPWDPYIMNQVKNELEAYFGISEQQMNTGGMKIVTTINYSYMKQLYAAVQENEASMKQQGGAIPSYAMVGAELQDPSSGAILAEYPGPGQNMSSKACAKIACDLNTAAYTREQVGSSFKPYVLAEAVLQGMNAQDSTLNAYSPLWVPPDSEPMTMASTNKNTAQYNWFKVNNDGDQSLGAQGVRNAFAQSSNTAFTDLIHRVGTKNVVNFAQLVGVNTQPSAQGGSNLENSVGQVGMALGIDSLTVNEQDTMLSTLANGGTYHQSHLIQSVTWGASVKNIQPTARVVLTPAQDSQVQWVMQSVTTDGTGTAAAMTDGRPIIAKTGTTTSYRSAFFIGAIPQAALTVGIFTQEQGDQICDSHGKNCKPNSETLQYLGGTTGQTGFGGYWPARIWHSFMESAFGSSQIEYFQSPVFTGTAWDMAPKVVHPKKKRSGGGTGGGGHHKKFPGAGATPAPSTSTSGTTNGTSSPAAMATSSGLILALPMPLLRRGLRRRRKRG